MKRKLTKFLTVTAAVTAMGAATAGTASAYIHGTTITPITLVTQSWGNNDSNDVTYQSAWTGAGPSARLWNLGDGNRPFSGTNFTLTENGSVTLKVNQYDIGTSHSILPLSNLNYYLYAGGFDRSTPTMNRVSVDGVSSWDGTAELTLDLLAGTTYTFVITTDLTGSQLQSGQQWVTSEIIETSPVPVPAAAWLLGSGLVGLFGARRKGVESK